MHYLRRSRPPRPLIALGRFAQLPWVRFRWIEFLVVNPGAPARCWCRRQYHILQPCPKGFDEL